MFVAFPTFLYGFTQVARGKNSLLNKILFIALLAGPSLLRKIRTHTHAGAFKMTQ